VVEGVEHPHPIKVVLYELLELLLDDPHHIFSLRAQPHDQLSYFSDLPSVNVGNSASARFLM